VNQTFSKRIAPVAGPSLSRLARLGDRRLFVEDLDDALGAAEAANSVFARPANPGRARRAGQVGQESEQAPRVIAPWASS
jgi:hypothetical protein